MQSFYDCIGGSDPFQRLANSVASRDAVFDALHELLNAGERTVADRLTGLHLDRPRRHPASARRFTAAHRNHDRRHFYRRR